MHGGSVLCALLCTMCTVSAHESTVVRFSNGRGSVMDVEYDKYSVLFRVSEQLRACTAENATLECEPRTFNMVNMLFDGLNVRTGLGVRCIIEMLRLVERLGVAERDAERIEFYCTLAKVSTVDANFRREIEKHRGGIPGIETYMLEMLRVHAMKYGVCVVVARDRATLCTMSSCWNGHNESGTVSRACAVVEVRVLEDAMDCIRESGDKRALSLLLWFMCTMGACKLDVSMCELDIDAVKCIGDMSSLRELKMHGCGLTPKSLSYIEGLENLTTLDISGNLLGQGMFGALSSFVVCRPACDDCGLSVIGRLERVVELNVDGCKLKLGCLKHIKNMGLRALNVSGNVLGVDDIDVIGNMENLLSLSMRSCLKRQESECEAGVVSGSSEMRVSYVASGDDSTHEGEKALNISGMGEKVVSSHLLPLKRLTQLQELNISNNRLHTDDVSSVIAHIKSLTKLYMSKCSLVPGSISSICSLDNLKELSISRNRLGPTELRAVSRLKNIAKLHMYECVLKQGTLELLKDIRTLVSLDVSGISLNRSDVLAIGATKSLKTLSMSHCRLVPGSLECIRELRELTDLNVSLNRLNSRDTRVIGGIKNLVQLNISGCEMEPGSLLYIRNAVHLMYLYAKQVRNTSKEDMNAMRMLTAEGVHAVF